MIASTRGIVMGYIKYRESSIIVRIYTEGFGYQSFIVNSIRSARSKQSIANFQPFTFLDLVIYLKPNKDLHRISEYKPTLSWYNNDVRRQTVLLFLAEVLDKLLRNESTENEELFSFISQSLRHYKLSEKSDNFHLQFLLKISELLGITVLSGIELFENMNRIEDHESVEVLVNSLLSCDISDHVPSNGALRLQALEILMQYFRHHIPNFGEVQSLKVLQQIFR